MIKENERPIWQVEIVISGGKKLYRVFRIKDPTKKDTSDNRETRGGLYDSYIDADRLRRILNEEESSHESR